MKSNLYFLLQFLSIHVHGCLARRNEGFGVEEVNTQDGIKWREMAEINPLRDLGECREEPKEKEDHTLESRSESERKWVNINETVDDYG